MIITKKEKVRKCLLNLDDRSTFTLSSIALACGVSTKDVSNVTGAMFKHGVFTRILDGGVHIYTADSNAINLYMAKYPSGMPGENKKQVEQVVKPVKRVKRRSACVMEIDNKISELQVKITQLKTIRREFV